MSSLKVIPGGLGESSGSAPNDPGAAPAPLEAPLVTGSDHEIAGRMKPVLRNMLIIFVLGAWWRFVRGLWRQISENVITDAIARRYDGTRVGKKRISLSIRQTESIARYLAEHRRRGREDFFDLQRGRRGIAASRLGVNTRSGFVGIARDGSVTVESPRPSQRQRFRVEAEYLPRSARPPRRQKLAAFLKSMFWEDPEGAYKQCLIQELAGAALLGLGPLCQRVVVLYGPRGGEGKSQLVELIGALLPESAVTAIPPQEFKDKFHIIALRDSFLNAPGELANFAIDATLLKGLATGDKVSGRNIGRDMETFQPRSIHIICTNHPPRFIGGIDEGTNRRLLVVHLLRQIPIAERIPEVARLIVTEERPALLQWAIQGARRLIRNNFRFTEPPSSRAELQEIGMLDPVRGFVNEVCEFDANAPDLTSVAVHAAFRAYCKDRGVRQVEELEVFCKRATPLLEQLGCERRRTKHARGFAKLLLTSPYKPEQLTTDRDGRVEAVTTDARLAQHFLPGRQQPPPGAGTQAVPGSNGAAAGPATGGQGASHPAGTADTPAADDGDAIAFDD